MTTTMVFLLTLATLATSASYKHICEDERCNPSYKDSENAYPTVPSVQIVTITSVTFNGDISLAVRTTSARTQSRKLRTIYAYPLSAVMKTSAASLLAAALAAPVRSVSLREGVTMVPSFLARAVIASTGYKSLSVIHHRKP